MTTIATNGRSMAGDGQADIGDTIMVTNRRKVYRTSQGVLLGCAGRSVDAQRFRAWFDDRNAAKPRLKEFQALALYADGRLEYWNEDMEPTEMQAPCSIGSGMDFALGAMMAGADPGEAVRIAATRDPFTGGDIIVEHLA